MEVHPHVRELLRFETQRLGIPIHLEPDPPGSSASIAVVVPSADTPLTTWQLLLADDTCTDVALAALPDGELASVPAPSGAIAVAAAVGHSLHLAFNPSDLASPELRPTLARLWDAAVAPALSTLAGHVRDEVAREGLQAFVEAEERAWRATARRLPVEIDNLEYSVAHAETQLRDQLRKLVDLRRQQRALNLALPDAMRQAAREQHDALQRLVPGLYRSVSLRDGTLVGVTGPIVLEDDEGEVEVGTFEVGIDLDRPSVTIRNATHVVHGVHHPHVRDEHEPCWGNLRAGVTRLLAEREWAGLLTVTSQLLRSYTAGDAYQALSAWDPDRSEQGEDDPDGEDPEGEDVACAICLERVAEDGITQVQGERICLDCHDRDTVRCGGCSQRILSRNIARETMRCRSCARAAAPVQEVAS